MTAREQAIEKVMALALNGELYCTGFCVGDAERIVDALASQPVVERQITDDARSAVVLVAPTSPAVDCAWRGMALAGGKVVNSIVGASRAVVLEDCIDALEAALGAPSQETGEPT